MKRLISFDVQQSPEPRVHGRTKKESYFLATVLVENKTERIELEMNNLQPVLLQNLLPLVTEKFIECFGELSPITEGRFTIYEVTNVSNRRPIHLHPGTT